MEKIPILLAFLLKQMDDIQDLPYAPGTVLNDTQKDELIKYNYHDVKATVLFWIRTLAEIEFRNELTDFAKFKAKSG